jgi:hypothetical protein
MSTKTSDQGYEARRGQLKLYSEMSVKFPDEDFHSFPPLAADEAKHKLIFEKTFDD